MEELTIQGKDRYDGYTDVFPLGSALLKDALRRAQAIQKTHKDVVLKDMFGYSLSIVGTVYEPIEGSLKPYCITLQTWERAKEVFLSVHWENSEGITVPERQGKSLFAIEEGDSRFFTLPKYDLTMDRDIAEDLLRFVLNHPYPGYTET